MNTTIPYSPAPTPPKITSPSNMLIMGTIPESGERLSCMAFTAPHEASVVTTEKQYTIGNAETGFLCLPGLEYFPNTGLVAYSL